MHECEAECVINRLLPAMQTDFCFPLAVVARSMRITAFVAKSILVMLCPSQKINRLFEQVLYQNKS